MTADSRRAIGTVLRTAEERFDAADVLRDAPHRAAALQELAQGLRLVEEALRTARNALPEADRAASALSATTEAELGALRERLAAVPPLDGALSRADLTLGRDARKRGRTALRELAKLTRGRRTVLVRRGLGVAAVLAVVGLALWLSGRRDRFEVSASDYFGRERFEWLFIPERAVDGDLASEWLTPQGGDGSWLELKYSKPIAVSRVRVVNGHNGSYNDRAVKELDVELYRGAKRLARARTSFTGIDKTPAARDVEVTGRGVDRVRFVVKEHHGLGGAITQVEVIEPKR